MREILFRGKRIDNGEWVYGDLVQSPAHGVVQIYELDLCGDNFGVDPSTVGQYTGLNDKNGKKIFEGDIVKIKNDLVDFERVTAVMYDSGLFGIKPKDHLLHCIIPLSSWYNSQIEVIGNVYDNPELLEGNP